MCNHPRVIVVSTGSVRLSCGEYDDDIVERVECALCGEIITEDRDVVSPVTIDLEV